MRKPVYSRVYAACDDADERAAFAEAEWADLIADLKGRGQLTEQRKRIVHRLVAERVEYEFLMPTVAAEGAVKEGPNGGDVFNFKWSALQKHKDQILKLEESLKLTVDKAAPVDAKPVVKSKADKYLAKARSH